MNALVETAFALLERPRFLAHLVKARKHIYKTVFSLNAEFCPSREPVDFQNRSSLEFTPVKRGQKWADMFAARLLETVPDAQVALLCDGSPENAASLTLAYLLTKAGLPIGLQLQAPPLEEDRLLRAAHMYQQATKHHTRRPRLGA